MPNRKTYIEKHQVQAHESIQQISGTELRQRLKKQLPIPTWFSFPEIIKILQRHAAPADEAGLTLLLTGLSGAGKTTLACKLATWMKRYDPRKIELLDGDQLRKTLSQDLGFSREDRLTHLKRVTQCAKEITQQNGIVICALIAPYANDRAYMRAEITEVGHFVEVYLDTPLAICEARDVKGLYAKARAGEITSLTGLQSPYEAPHQPELRLNTSHSSPDEDGQRLLSYLVNADYVAAKHYPKKYQCYATNGPATATN